VSVFCDIDDICSIAVQIRTVQAHHFQLLIFVVCHSSVPAVLLFHFAPDPNFIRNLVSSNGSERISSGLFYMPDFDIWLAVDGCYKESKGCYISNRNNVNATKSAPIIVTAVVVIAA